MLGIYKIGENILYHDLQFTGHSVNDIVWHLLFTMVEFSIALVLMKFAKYLVVILLSPLLAQLSMKCEKIITGNEYPFDGKQLWQDVIRGVRIVTRNIMWEYFFFSIIYLIAALGWKEMRMSPIFYLSFAIGFYYYGFSFIDYVNERRKLTVDQSILFMRKNRGLAVAIGLGYSFLLLMPVDISKLFAFSEISKAPIYTISNMALHLVLWVCAAIAPILAIVSSTLAMHKIVDLKKSNYIVETK